MIIYAVQTRIKEEGIALHGTCSSCLITSVQNTGYGKGKTNVSCCRKNKALSNITTRRSGSTARITLLLPWRMKLLTSSQKAPNAFPFSINVGTCFTS